MASICQDFKWLLAFGFQIPLEYRITKSMFFIFFCFCMYGIQIPTVSFFSAYHRVNNTFPSTVVVFRDGVGDSQLSTSAKQEVTQLMTCFRDISSKFFMIEKIWSPILTLCSVFQWHSVLNIMKVSLPQYAAAITGELSLLPYASSSPLSSVVHWHRKREYIKKCCHFVLISNGLGLKWSGLWLKL